MILTCPNCETRFSIDEKVLQPNGRRVKCTDCAHIWFQEPIYADGQEGDEQEAAASEQEAQGDDEAEASQDTKVDADSSSDVFEDIPDSVKPLPEKYSKKELTQMQAPFVGLKGKAIAAGVVFLLVSLVLYFGLSMNRDALVRSWPSSAAFFGMLGMEIEAPGKDLVFDRIVVNEHKSADAKGDSFIDVSGTVLNLGSTAQYLPLIEVSLKGAHDEVLSKFYIDLEEPTVDAEASVQIEASHAHSHGSVYAVLLRFVYSKDTAENDMAGTEMDASGMENHHEAVVGSHGGQQHSQDAHQDAHGEGAHDMSTQMFDDHQNGEHHSQNPASDTLEDDMNHESDHSKHH